MANEVDFKIELKVSANCCEGSKRKVKKALRNPEVLGNVNPHILIKKLQKVGKHAELWSYEEFESEEKEELLANEKEKQNVWEQEKQPHPCDIKIDKTKDVTRKKKASKACVEEHMPRFEPPPFLRPTERVGDYFSDENTTGCHVM
ncbi:Heavy metal-associated isoprenylated plant protein 36 [Glycine max]|uniref:Uncharacterized protein n=1 Tax=Glycine soja TaxID=3848 RepID=A0A445GIV6_GLYSO|nr:Heavy metal-associated isoprenylated plant protein 36 [Glycine max]RZB61145.1 hypothetical protein D0Y65_043766 [Glycine soja]